jgi:2-amino-4-hydroxy-6-hydroxymethyldihydropteridine diphosphokinase
MKNRNFVLFPLFEIEKNWQHPSNNRNIIDLMYNLSSKSLTTIKQI